MNVFELFATLGLDSSEYEKGLDSSESKGKQFASSVGSVIGKGVQVGVAAATAAVGAAATGITTLTTQAVQAYGTYEQLIGGVEKIFGEDADAVVQHASEAFATAGMSANQYMETVTSFSASLIQNLEGDTAAAVEYADMAIRDMSDNANTFGTDISSIQNAYQGFAKQNYTMLDNLKLGYGGTKTEMERLIQDAAALSEEFEVQYDEAGDLVYGYADIVQAIHIVQEEMNVTGTTAKEASNTIQGTAGSLQSAWENLIIGLGDANQDLEPLINNVVQSALKMVENVIPIALQAVNGISELIQKAAPIIESELPPLIQSILPALTDAIVMLINTAAAILPSLIETLLPPVLSAVTNVFLSLIKALPTILRLLSSQLPVILRQVIPAILLVLPDIISAVLEIAMAVGTALADNIDIIMDAIISVVHMLVDNFLTGDNIAQFIILVNQITLTIVGALLENLPELLGAAVILLVNIIEGLIQAAPVLIEQFASLILQLGDKLGDDLFSLLGTSLADMINSVIQWFANIGSTIKEWGSNFLAGLSQFLTNLLYSFVEFLNNPIEYTKNTFAKLKELVTNGWNAIKTFLSDRWNTMKNNVVNGLNATKTFITNVVEALKLAIPNAVETVKNKVSNGLNAARDKFISIFDKVKETAQKAIDFLKALFSGELQFPKIKVPHFSVSGQFNLDPTNFQIPKISVEWYKKAMQTPYLLEDATIFGAAGGKLLGAGESGSEVVVGTDKLMSMMQQAVGIEAKPITINVYGAMGQDVRELAKEVSQELQNLINDKESVYA